MIGTAKTYDLRLVKWWRRILALNDRRIQAIVVSGDEMHRLSQSEPNEDSPSGYAVSSYNHQASRIWLNRDAEDIESAEHIILHEVLHVETDDMYRFTRNLINNFIPDAATKQHLHDELECHNERQTNRLTRAFLRLKATKAKTEV